MASKRKHGTQKDSDKENKRANVQYPSDFIVDMPKQLVNAATNNLYSVAELIGSVNFSVYLIFNL